jgi:hypothetical protein
MLISSCPTNGRLGNHIIKYISCSIICKKHNLSVDYNYKNDKKFLNQIEKIGILLFYGRKQYKRTMKIDDTKWYAFFSLNESVFNVILPRSQYFQNKIITNEIIKYLHDEEIMNHYINNNHYKTRFNNNNDCFIHIRLGDVAKHLNLDKIFKYYKYVLNTINVEHIYISSDSPSHNKIKELLQLYSNSSIIYYNEVDTIHFGSTCKYVILSHGTFSATIGYLSYYSNVYYYIPDYKKKVKFENIDLFTDKYSKFGSWIGVNISLFDYEIQVNNETSISF